MAYLLLMLTACGGGRSVEMAALLDRADSLNRAYVPMTDGIDSLLLEATKYYDRHGTANQQMRAHYLLGCAYRDMGEAPAALQSYQDAVDRADTLSSDCDYQRLMAVYGQMADLFDAQNLPTEELRIIELYGKLTLMEKDTLKYIRNLELMYKPYYLMNDTIHMYQVLEEAKRLYMEHGYTEQSASMDALLAFHQLQKGNIAEAGKLLEIFERESGLLDDNDNVAGDRKYYYIIKGQYYQKTGKQIEAEHYYRKALSCGQHLLGYKSLLSLYSQKPNVDSVKKYAQLYEMAMDSLQNNIQTEALLKTSNLYSYQRFKEKAEKEEEQVKQAQRRLWYGGVTVTLLLVACSLYIHYFRKRKKGEMIRIYTDYLGALSLYNKSTDELRQMKEDSAQFEKTKLQEIEMLQKQIDDFKDKRDNMNTSQILSAFSHSDIVKSFHRKAEQKRNIQQPNRMEWKSLYSIMTAEIPRVSTLIGGERILSTQELHVCLLLILGFTNIEIYKLTNLTPQRYSNLRRIINKKLFGEDKAATIEQNIKDRLFNM
jgi:hypothetical protein